MYEHSTKFEKKAGFLEICNSSAFITECFFTNGQGVEGGALYIEESYIKINKAHFINNSATSFDGAIFLKVTNNNCKVLFISSLINIKI